MRPVLVLLPRDVEEGIVRAAADAHPREACGVVAGGRLVVLQNSLGDGEAGDAFAVDPGHLEQALRPHGGWAAVTHVWHSHPVRADGSGGSPAPSRVDVEAHPVGPVLTIVADGHLYGWVHEAPGRPSRPV